jgi:hypothetical protein
MKKDITLTIDGKMHKLMDDGLVPCPKCSLHDFCGYTLKACPAIGLGGEYFVELKVEK